MGDNDSGACCPLADFAQGRAFPESTEPLWRVKDLDFDNHEATPRPAPFEQFSFARSHSETPTVRLDAAGASSRNSVLVSGSSISVSMIT